MTAVLDLEHILAHSKWGMLAREVIQGAGKEYEADLLTCVLQDIAGLIQKAGDSGAFTLLVERRRAGVLYVSSTADITPFILAAYDAMYETAIARSDRATVMQQLEDHFAAVVKAREAGEPSTGQYL